MAARGALCCPSQRGCPRSQAGSRSRAAPMSNFGCLFTPERARHRAPGLSPCCSSAPANTSGPNQTTSVCLDTKTNHQQFRGFFSLSISPPKLFARSQEFYLLQAENISFQAFLSVLSSSQLSRSEKRLPHLPTTSRHCPGLAPRSAEGTVVTAAPGCPSRALPAQGISPGIPSPAHQPTLGNQEDIFK